MQFDQERPRLEYRGSVSSRAKNMMFKAVAMAGAAVMLVSALAFSILFFALGLTVVLVVGVYLWWKTRHLRRQIRTQFAHAVDSDVIEGVVVRQGEETPTRRGDQERGREDVESARR